MSIQTNNFVFQEGDMGRAVAQWMQQLIGVQRQQVTIYNYSGITNASYDGEFQRPYGGGGLLDLRTLEASVTASNDLKYLGVAQIMEAWMIGTTADVWGDIPYSQAGDYFTYPTPTLDTQQDVYNAVEALLTQAIGNLAGAGTGPSSADLVYGGERRQVDGTRAYAQGALLPPSGGEARREHVRECARGRQFGHRVERR